MPGRLAAHGTPVCPEYFRVATTEVLQQLSTYLRGLLVAGTDGLPGELKQQNISFESPVEFDNTPPGNVRLSLYLYHVEKNAHLNNEPLLRVGGELRVRPFYVDLHYLLTPVANQPVENLHILAACMQVFAANGLIRAPFLELAREPSAGEARLRMLFHDLEAMNKLWGALARPYRLSVAYEVSPVPIESVLPPVGGPPVVEAVLDVQQMNEGG